MNNKLFFGLTDRFMKLCQCHEDLYFKERPFLETPRILVHSTDANGKGVDTWENASQTILDFSCERKQIELEMCKVSDKIDKMCNPAKPIEDQTIEDLFGPVAA